MKDGDGMSILEVKAMLEGANARERTDAIRECVTWLAVFYADFKPECLAGEMARSLLPKTIT